MPDSIPNLWAVRLIKIILLSACLLGVGFTQNQQPAFPGAEGFGRYTSGGRGGQVIEVTNLNDSGPGSLRAAVENSGPRTVVFRISGTIALRSTLFIRNNNITIAGQTAPGDGICVRDYDVLLQANNIIIRYIRFRMGDRYRLVADALGAIRQSDIIIDHCSMSWGIDEVASFYDNRNFTMQWCLISESLNHSYHPKGAHGYGGIWGGNGATFHHNLLAHHSSRNPRFNGSRTNGGIAANEIVDHRNNVIYNWSENSAYGGEAGNQNMINNYYKYGPATRSKSLRRRIVNPWGEDGRWYVSGNYVYGFPAITLNNWAGGVLNSYVDKIRLDNPVPSAPVVTHSAETAYRLVLVDVGAVLPRRDPIDSRIIEEVQSGTATYGTGIIDSQSQVGGWPELNTSEVPADSDHDGMADAWEVSVGLNSASAYDGNQDRDGDGYTNLEEYLNHLCLRSDYLPAPAELTARLDSSENVILTWNYVLLGQEGFCLERAEGDTAHFKEIARIEPVLQVFTDNGLRPSNRYYYRLYAFKGNIKSMYTDICGVVIP